ncbi:DM13 domain-containing protein [Actibacterium sp. 188UL27-1]|uniref:DM13 domain-containing protein n=1 Tax=Actibacterium sp. 188UL27-1 TaxID=2786961 RepID=UPI00195E630A|nr:DM13 domain-containing protein [Actibacterium sp. 188UL27-1]MBM7067236.1 DM13 domain-containing protein [Actibacterium sp. 188UL27-1]
MISRRTFLASAAAIPAAASLSIIPNAVSAMGRGTFRGASNHVTRGSVAIVSRDGRNYVQLGNDFFFDGAPDPWVALGRNGYARETRMSKLAKTSGAQLYRIPANLDLSKYNQVYLWCERFSVPLGVANLR